mgnify:FL=1
MAAISELEKAKIQREAHEILERFSKSLAKVKITKKVKKEKARGFREEEQGMKGDDDFKRRMLANAPEHDEDAILAEKKKW